MGACESRDKDQVDAMQVYPWDEAAAPSAKSYPGQQPPENFEGKQNKGFSYTLDSVPAAKSFALQNGTAGVYAPSQTSRTGYTLSTTAYASSVSLMDAYPEELERTLRRLYEESQAFSGPAQVTHEHDHYRSEHEYRNHMQSVY